MAALDVFRCQPAQRKITLYDKRLKLRPIPFRVALSAAHSFRMARASAHKSQRLLVSLFPEIKGRTASSDKPVSKSARTEFAKKSELFERVATLLPGEALLVRSELSL